ncbi:MULTISPECIES: hypothetical protein [unclassified Moraxella]|uniref:hypothetical protein n=1 Tax=unclassified Moraxella TaxID=2685852 RepID=UPI003AF73847
MKHFALLTAVAMFGLPAVAQANTQQVNACVTQMTEKNIMDKASAQKVCSCVVKEQAKITRAQKTELDNWVKSGKDVRQNKTFQTISGKMKACSAGIK